MFLIDRDRLITTLGTVAEHWRNAGPAPITALMVSTGLPERLVRLALDHAFSELTAPKLQALQTPSVSGRKAYIVCPGNVFSAWLPSAIQCLLAGYAVYLKPSIHEPVFPRLWRESVIAADESFASRISLWTWAPAHVAAGDRVIVYGHDETLQRLHAQVPQADFIGFGHQTSAAVIFPEAMTPDRWPETREAARAAIEPFQLKGCLSPQVIWVPKEFLEVWRGFSQKIQPFPEVRPYTDLEEIRAGLQSWPGRLALVGYAGDPDVRSKILQTLVPEGSRVCPMRSMQRPSLVAPTVGNP